MKAVFVCFALASLIFAMPADRDVLDDNMIDYINSHTNLWTAARNSRFEGMKFSQAKKLAGAWRKDHGKEKRHYDLDSTDTAPIPTSFDARETWSFCPHISYVRDQGACASCWAVAGAQTITSRLCIASNGTVTPWISEQGILTCCENCGLGCDGGYTNEVWEYYVNNGVVSGGPYGSNMGCRPYTIPPCEHATDITNGSYAQCGNLLPTPPCEYSCESDFTETKYTINDEHYGQEWYPVSAIPKEIQYEILQFGPVQAVFSIYLDFFSYHSGIYQHVTGEYVGLHSAQIIGWGEDTVNGTSVPYWLVMNIWNKDWGMDGLFKILRGVDEVGIEGDLFAGLPALSMSPPY